MKKNEIAFIEQDKESVADKDNDIPAVLYEPCISISNQSVRVKWVKDNINPINLDGVKFCPACCEMLAELTNNNLCMTLCESALTFGPPAADLFDKCFAGDKLLAVTEQLAECKMCVDDLKGSHPEVDDIEFGIKKGECDTKFRCIDDDSFECTGSWALDSEEEKG